MVYELAKKLLFCLDPEQSHTVATKALDKLSEFGLLKPFFNQIENPVSIMGLRFPNPVGLAAGFDKNAEHVDAMFELGFGFIEVGTVTPKPQDGNPKPRLFRIPEANALINRMGFNNFGLGQFLENVDKIRTKGILGINIGKNATTPIENALSDYLTCLEAVHDYGSYIVVNISSPNTANLRSLQMKESLLPLLSRLRERADELDRASNRKVPLVLKIAPDLNSEELAGVLQSVKETKIDGLICTNTTIDKSFVAGFKHGDEQGGLSGDPLRYKSPQMIAEARAILGQGFPLIGSGGVMSLSDALNFKNSGADLIQLYTGFIYRGPGLVRDIAAGWQ